MWGLKEDSVVSNDAVTPLHQRQAIVEARKIFEEARRNHDKAKESLDAVGRILSPPIDSAAYRSLSVNELDVIRANVELPQIQRAFFETSVALKAANRAYQATVEQERNAVTLARVSRRKQLIPDLFRALDEAVELANAIQKYDEETRELGGVPPPHPAPELLSDAYRQNFVDANRYVLKKEGWL